MKRAKVEEGEENQFERLPDEVVIEILNKLVHVKHLLRCSSVCKRFGSLICHIRTMFLPNLSRFPTKLSRFSAVWSIHLDMNEISSDLEQPLGPFFKFKALFRAHLDVMVIIISTNVHKSQNVASSNGGGAVVISDEFVFNMVGDTLNYSLKLHDFTRILVSQNTVLDKLLIDTPRGKLYMGKDEIAELRTAKSLDPPSETFEFKMLHGRLELPASGIVIPCAYIAVVRPRGEEIVMEKDLGLILGSFRAKYGEDSREDNVEKVFNESVDVVRKKIAS